MTTQFRSVVVCNHPRPYRKVGDHKYLGCDYEDGHRTPSSCTWSSEDLALSEGYSTQEYNYGYDDDRHFVEVESRQVTEWEYSG